MESFHLLHIEDNQVDAFLVKWYLRTAKNCKFDITHVTTLASAFEEISTDHPDVVLMDLGLSDNVGLAGLKKLLKEYSELCVIVITGDQNSNLGRKAMKIGAQDYLSKSNLSEEFLEKALLFSLERIQNKIELLKKDYEIDHLSRAVEQSTNIIVMTDLSGIIYYVNKNFCSVTGYKKNEIVGKNISILKSGQHDPTFFEIIWKTISSGKTWQGEIINKTKKGDLFWEHVTIDPIKDDFGKINGYLSIKENITEQKRAMQLLEKSESQLKKAQQMGKMGSFEWDARSNEFNWSDELYRIFGLEPKSVGIGIEFFISFIHPKDRDFFDQQFFKSLKEAEDHSIEFRICLPNNKIKHILLKEEEVRGESQLINVSGICQDITDRKNREKEIESSKERLLEYINNAPYGIVLTDSLHRVIDCNPAFCELSGYVKEELIEKNRDEVFNIKMSNPEDFEKSIESSRLRYIIQFVTKKGDNRYLNINSIRLEEKRTLTFVLDVTEHKNHLKKIEELASNFELENQKLQLTIGSGNLLGWEINLKSNKMTFYPEDKENNFFGNSASIDSLKGFLNQIHPRQRSIFTNKMKRHTQNKNSFFETEFKIRSVDTSKHWKWVYARGKVLVRDEEGRPLTAYGIVQDIDWKKETESMLLRGQELERKRVSMDIHDSIGQMLVGTRFLVNKSITSTGKQSDINLEVDKMLNSIIKETRMIINNLGVSLFENDSLKLAFESLIRKMQQISTSAIKLTWSGDADIPDASFSTHIFRILQEALSNAIRYSSASTIRVKVKNNDSFYLTITDNGNGFDSLTISEGFGIENMKSRAESIKGNFLIESKKDVGTKVQLSIE